VRNWGIFYQFPRYTLKIWLGDISVKVGREDVFKLTVRMRDHTELLMAVELK
jgi:hypothetical protein